MIDHINLRRTLYPLPRMRNGYFSSNKCCGCTIADVESGNQPLSCMGSGNIKNTEGNDLDNRKPFLETYYDRGCPATGHPCPKKLKDGEG